MPGGYRIGLWQRLTGGGYRVDLVGSQYNGPASLGDHDHEGHPGWRIDGIVQGTANTGKRVPDPGTDVDRHDPTGLLDNA